jgi:hypothetical protein
MQSGKKGAVKDSGESSFSGVAVENQVTPLVGLQLQECPFEKLAAAALDQSWTAVHARMASHFFISPHHTDGYYSTNRSCR